MINRLQSHFENMKKRYKAGEKNQRRKLRTHVYAHTYARTNTHRPLKKTLLINTRKKKAHE